MRFFEDIDAERDRIEAAIKKFGYAAEHNFFWYKYYRESGNKNIYVESDRGSLFTTFNPHKNAYWVVFDPLASPEDRAPLLAEYIEWIFANTDAAKVWFQVETATRGALLRIMPEQYRSNRVYFTLTWPVYDLEDFDPTMPGGRYKTLRKGMHKFYREHRVEVVDAKTYADVAALHAVVDNWAVRRPNHDSTSPDQYHHIVGGKFAGADEARTFLVDGRPCGFNAGWMVPNHDRFYGAVGIHDYSEDGLGAMLYMEDLIWLKAHGYREVDMAGSEKPLLAFKNKFCFPKWSYQTSHFSVVTRR